MSKSYVAMPKDDNGKISLTIAEFDGGHISGVTLSILCDSYQMQGSTVVVDVGHYNSLSVYECATGNYLTSIQKF